MKKHKWERPLPRYANNNIAIVYIDEVEFNKRIKGLRRSNMRAYKQLLRILREGEFNQEPGKHETELIADEKLKLIYGKILLHYETNENYVLLTGITPDNLLLDVYNSKVNYYKGVPIKDSKDLFKIKLLEEMN